MGVLESICHEVANLKLKGHYPETDVMAGTSASWNCLNGRPPSPRF
jgi:hypothetical protein